MNRIFKETLIPDCCSSCGVYGQKLFELELDKFVCLECIDEDERHLWGTAEDRIPSDKVPAMMNQAIVWIGLYLILIS
jgi:hypothetical protein